MNIKIIAIGKMREKGLKLCMDEFIKRLSPYCSFSVVEISAESIKDETLAQKYKKEEAIKILNSIKPSTYVITLEINGKNLSSEDFATKIKEISLSGTNELAFIIGGANGIDESVSQRADFKLSFSKMTFPHQMARVMLTEQIYRAMKILNNENYHR